MNKTEFTVSNRTIIRVVFIALGSVLAIELLGRLQTQLIWIFTALFFALALEPAVDWLSRYMPKKSRALAVLTVILGALSVLVFIILALIPPFASQLYNLSTNLPTAYSDFLDSNPTIGRLLADLFGGADVGSNLQELSKQLLSFGGSAGGIIGGIFGGLVAVITVILLTFFMVLEGPRWINAFWSYQPAQRRRELNELLVKLHKTVTGYMGGNLFTSLVAAVASSIALLVLGVPYALALGLLVGIVDLIPMVGATLAAVLVSLMVLVFKGVNPALIMAVFFILYQQLENNILQPIVFSKAVEVSPLVTTLALILGASIAGFIGALVAIPVAASAQILLKYWLSHRRPRVQKA